MVFNITWKDLDSVLKRVWDHIHWLHVGMSGTNSPILA